MLRRDLRYRKQAYHRMIGRFPKKQQTFSMKQEYMKRILILTLFVLSTATAAFAQKVTVSGTVKDSDGNPLPGV